MKDTYRRLSSLRRSSQVCDWRAFRRLDSLRYTAADSPKEQYRLRPMPGAERFRTRVERQYIKGRYPILFERMREVATAFGRQLEDDAWDFSGLLYAFNLRPGCSVVYYPPEMTADGKRT